MNVVALEWKHDAGMWSEQELQTIITALNAAWASGNGRGWDIGTTERSDPQFYLLGPLPEQACRLCVSRVGGRYILEDGAGKLLFEHPSLPLVALHAKAAASPRRWSLAARLLLVWCTLRHAFDDKVEPLLVEGEELLIHLAPKLAAFA